MMGWVRPNIVGMSGRYTLKPSIEYPQLIKITAGYPAHEYLLIENRQKIGFDAKLPKSGLVIYKIDELASFYKNPGYDGQEGWPENGNHFRVAILQRDGKYELEKGLNRGDEFDVYGPGDEIGPGSTTSRGPYPNTDSYQSGNIKPTGIRIYDIQQEGENISFQIDIPGSISDAPTKSPVAMIPENVATSELGTTFTGEIGEYPFEMHRTCRFHVSVELCFIPRIFDTSECFLLYYLRFFSFYIFSNTHKFFGCFLQFPSNLISSVSNTYIPTIFPLFDF